MKKLIILLLLPFGLKAQTLTMAQLTTRLVAAEANITAINTKLSGIYTTLDSYKAQLVSLSARTGILEAMPKDSIKVDKGLTLSNKVISLDTSFTDARYLNSILQLALFYSTLDKRTGTLEGKVENAIGRLILLEEFRKALKNL